MPPCLKRIFKHIQVVYAKRRSTGSTTITPKSIREQARYLLYIDPTEGLKQKWAQKWHILSPPLIKWESSKKNHSEIVDSWMHTNRAEATCRAPSVAICAGSSWENLTCIPRVGRHGMEMGACLFWENPEIRRIYLWDYMHFYQLAGQRWLQFPRIHSYIIKG